MNAKKRLTNLFAVVALGAGIAMFSPAADAKPRDRDVKEERKELKKERKDLKKARKEVRKADSAEERREARENVREERRDVKDARKDVREERRENRNDNDWNNNRGTYNRGTYNNRNSNNGRYNQNNDYRTFTGRVTDVNSNGEFKLRVGNQALDVFTNNRLPRGFDEGDVVRVYGRRTGSNDVRNANVSIVNNR